MSISSKTYRYTAGAVMSSANSRTDGRITASPASLRPARGRGHRRDDVGGDPGAQQRRPVVRGGGLTVQREDRLLQPQHGGRVRGELDTLHDQRLDLAERAQLPGGVGRLA